MVHLGYLTYDSENEMIAIPNREVSKEYINAISTMDWTEEIKFKGLQRKSAFSWNQL